MCMNFAKWLNCLYSEHCSRGLKPVSAKVLMSLAAPELSLEQRTLREVVLPVK